MNYSGKMILGSCFRVANLAANVVVGFLLMPLIIHGLGDRIFGFWTLAANIIGYYGLLDLGIVSAVQFFVAKAIGEEDREKPNQTISTAFYVFMFIGFIVLLVTIILSGFTYKFVTDEAEVRLFRKVLLILGIGFSVGFPGRAFIGVISANLKWELISTVNIACLILRTTAIWFLLKNGGGIIGLSLIVVATDILTYTSFFLISKNIHTNFRIGISLIKLNVLKEIIKYSMYTFIIKTGDQLRFYFDAVVISKFIGLASVAHYSIASRLTIYFIDFMVALIGYLSPFFSIMFGKRDKAYIRDIYVISSKITIVIGTFISIVLILYGKIFISLWVGEKYIDAYMPLVILIIGVYFEITQLPSGSYLYGVAKHKYMAVIISLEGVLNVILSVILVQYYGVVGVALGTTIPMILFRLFIQPKYICENVGLKTGDYYFRILTKCLIGTSIPVLICWTIITRFVAVNSFFKMFFFISLQFILCIPIAYFYAFTKQEKLKLIEIVTKNENFNKKISSIFGANKWERN